MGRSKRAAVVTVSLLPLTHQERTSFDAAPNLSSVPTTALSNCSKRARPAARDGILPPLGRGFYVWTRQQHLRTLCFARLVIEVEPCPSRSLVNRIARSLTCSCAASRSPACCGSWLIDRKS